MDGAFIKYQTRVLNTNKLEATWYLRIFNWFLQSCHLIRPNPWLIILIVTLHWTLGTGEGGSYNFLTIAPIPPPANSPGPDKGQLYKY